jgi:hypothetical protein
VLALVLDHHGKSDRIVRALREGGIEVTDDPSERFDVVLCDSDHPDAPPAPYKNNVLQYCARLGIPIIIYPHGAPPDLDYDGMRHASVPISLRLVSGEGHWEVARRMGCKHRVEVVGWTLSEEVEDHGEGRSPSSLLFAPIHPWADGQGILEAHRKLNLGAYFQFLAYPNAGKTVRMYGADPPNGIVHREDDVVYVQSDLGPATREIDAADAVISYGTVAYTALARGKPVAMIYPWPGHTDNHGLVNARRFEDYKEYLRYPASIGDAPLDELFARDVSEWKRLFVGEPLDGDRLCSLVGGFKANRAQRRKLERMR